MGEKRRDRAGTNDIGRRLLALRTMARLTQAELAQILGVSKYSVLKWEGGDSYPSEAHLRHLLEAFVARAAFTPGHESAEAGALWTQVGQVAGKRLGVFDPRWLAGDSGQETDEQHQASPQAPLPNPQSLVDWDQPIDIPTLHGRESELATLEQWVLADRCRVVAVLGMGGIGKTSLVLTLTQQVASRFDMVLFRSLRNAPPFGPLLDGLIRTTSMQQAPPPDSIAGKIALLVQLCREQRCLLVLDNLETVMQAGDQAEDYADYRELVLRFSQVQHQSCLLLASREKPGELGPLEGRTAPVRILMLGGLAERACQHILEAKQVFGTAGDYAALARLYGGNPLALTLASEPIRTLYGSRISAFLASGHAFFNDVGELFEQQFARSTPLEQALLLWLAIARDLVPLEQLLANLAGTAGQREMLVALESLRRRLLIEQAVRQPAFTLQPVMLEYLTDRLVREVCQEIVAGRPALLRSHALVQATAKEYARRSQERLIGQAVLAGVVAACGGAEQALQQLCMLLARWQGQPHAAQGYGPGNLVNLLRLLRGHLRGLDLSRLAIRQAYLQDVDMQDTNLADSHLSQPALIEPFAGILSIALSADGRSLVAGTATGEVRLWRMADRTLALSIQAHTGSVMAVAISADGRRMASGGYDGMVRLWDGASGACVATLPGHGAIVRGVALSANGRVVASSGEDGTVRLWHAESDQPRYTLPAGTGWANRVALAADGQILASGSQDGTVRLWEIASGACLATLRGHTGAVSGVALSLDRRLVASGSADGTVRLWEIASGACLATLQGHSDAVLDVALSADGRLLASGSQDGTVRLWDSASGACLATLHGHTAAIWGVALAADGHVLASGSLDGTVRLWEPASGRPLAILQGSAGLVYSVALAADGRLLASGGIDHTIRLWEPASGRPLAILQGHTSRVWGVAMTIDGRILASGSDDRTVRLWDTASGTCLATLRGHTHAVSGVAFSADGRLLASGSFDGTVRLWEVEGGKCLGLLKGHTDAIYSVALSPDGRLAASGSGDGTVRLWQVASGTCQGIVKGHAGGVYSVALSTGGRLLASGGFDGTVRLWDVPSGACLATLQGHTDAIYGIALSADGRLLASGSGDRTVRLWEVESGMCQGILEGHSHAVMSVALSADGQVAASGGMDGTVRLWEAGSTIQVLRPDRPYERMDITHMTGTTTAQRAALKALGAVVRGD